MAYAAIETKWEDREKEVFKKGFQKGAGAALLMCNSLLPDGTNRGVADSQPECTPFIKETLGRMAGLPKPSPAKPSLWRQPTFSDASKSLRKLGLSERKMIIGYDNDTNKEIPVTFVGHVETYWVDDENDLRGFFRLCKMKLPDEVPMTGFVLGPIDGSGTALMIGQNDTLYAFSPQDAIGWPWSKLKSEGAELRIDENNKVHIVPIEGMRAACLDQY